VFFKLLDTWAWLGVRGDVRLEIITGKECAQTIVK